MTEVLGRVAPLLVLIGFGYILQRWQYFEDTSYQRLQHFLINICIPCLLFASFVKMEFHASYAWVSISYFLLMTALLAVGFLLQRLFRFKYRFFPFLLSSFGFGTMGLPLFSSMFGLENVEYISVLGIGHEFFIAVVFLPLAQTYFSAQKLQARQVAKALLNPTMVMVVLALAINFSGLTQVLSSNVLGVGLLGAISSLGGLTLVLALILIGYRLKFSDKGNLRVSCGYAAMRFGVTIILGIAYQLWVLNPLTGGQPLFNHAFYILLFQHSSILLTTIVGRYCPRQDQEVVNNTFVLTVLGGLALFIAYVIFFI